MSYTYNEEKKELTLTESVETKFDLQRLLRKKAGHEAKILVEQAEIVKVDELINKAKELGYKE